MGLFDKKYCDICGEKIGFLGNRKLADGNLCKNCAKKLSPWFSDRKKSTVQDIRDQLEWREENKKRVAAFHPTQTLGNNYYVMIDRQDGTFTVTMNRDLEEENPDILDLADVTGCNLDISESRREIMKEGPDNKEVSYNPPRYEYSYDFYCKIYVDNPFYNEIKFRLNTFTLHITMSPGNRVTSTMGLFSSSSDFNPQYDSKYQGFQREFEEIKAALTGQGVPGYNQQMLYGQPQGYGQQMQPDQQQAQYGQSQAGGYGAQKTNGYSQVDYNQQAQSSRQEQYTQQQVQPGASVHSGRWFCPSCGAPNTGKFCENCGSPRPVL